MWGVPQAWLTVVPALTGEVMVGLWINLFGPQFPPCERHLHHSLLQLNCLPAVVCNSWLSPPVCVAFPSTPVECPFCAKWAVGGQGPGSNEPGLQ